MSLRGSETTEAISQHVENNEIAALPLVARNDKQGPGHNPQGEMGDTFWQYGGDEMERRKQ